MLAQVLAGDKRIALIDTEGGTSEIYADKFDFDIVKLEEHSPDKFIAAIKHITDAGEYGAVILDSFSHAWMGNKGVLDIAGGRFTGWKSATPAHGRLITAIQKCPLHTIVTMRLKKVYEVADVNGKQEIRLSGVMPVQREGTEYEFDWLGQIDRLTHDLSIIGARDSAIDGKVYPAGSVDLAHDLLKVLSSGAPLLARYNPVKELEPGYEPPEETKPTK